MHGRPVRLKGTVVAWKSVKQYGFVEDEENNAFFLHRTSLEPPLCKEMMEEGMKVEFEPSMSKKGPIALNCCLLRTRSRSASPERKRVRSFSPDYPSAPEYRQPDSPPSQRASQPTPVAAPTASVSLSNDSVNLLDILLSSSNATTLHSIYKNAIDIFATQQEITAARDVHSIVPNRLSPETVAKAASNYTNALSFFLSTRPAELTVTYICGLHCIVASGMPYAGVLRQTVRPSCLKFISAHLSPDSSVADAISAMFQEFNAQLKNNDMRPYDDCNGRLARLMIQWVLRLRGLPFCISLCSPPLRQAYALAIRHSDSSKLAILIAEQVDAAWRRYFELTSSTLHQYCLSPSMSAKELCAAAMAKDVEEKQKTSRCSLCNNEDASVMLKCCKSSIHVNCLLSTYDSRDLSIVCPHCNSLSRDPEMLLNSGNSRMIDPYPRRGRSRSRS